MKPKPPTAPIQTAPIAQAMVDAAWAPESQESEGLQALSTYLAAKTHAPPTVRSALAVLSDVMQAAGISEDDTLDIVRTLTTTITQAQAKAAMRSKNTP